MYSNQDGALLAEGEHPQGTWNNIQKQAPQMHSLSSDEAQTRSSE